MKMQYCREESWYVIRFRSQSEQLVQHEFSQKLKLFALTIHLGSQAPGAMPSIWVFTSMIAGLPDFNA